MPLVESLTFVHLNGRNHLYGRIRLWGSVGFIVVVLGAGHVLNRLPADSVLWMAALMLAGIAMVSLVLPEGRTHPHVHDAPGFMSVLARREVRGLLAGGVLMSAAHGALYVFFSIYLVATGYSKAVVGWLWTLGVAAEIAVFMVMPRLAARFSLRRILLVAYGCAVVRFLLIGWGVESLAVLLVAQVLHGATFGAYHAASIAAINQWFPGRLQARGQAIYGSLGFGAGGMLGGLLSGYTWDIAGPAWTYTIASLFALIGWIIVRHGWAEDTTKETT